MMYNFIILKEKNYSHKLAYIHLCLSNIQQMQEGDNCSRSKKNGSDPDSVIAFPPFENEKTFDM